MATEPSLQSTYKRKCIREGTGLYCPNDGATVTIDLTGSVFYGDNSAHQLVHEIDKCFVLGHAFDDVLGRIVYPCLLSMKEHEQCQLVIDCEQLKLLPLEELASYANPIGTDVCQMVITVELKSFTRAKEVWALSVEERVVVASQHKSLGTERFSAELYRAACFHYAKAVQYLVPIFLPDVEVPKEIEELKKVCYLNLAACQLKLQQYASVEGNCKKVLSVDQTNVKALYRYSSALLHMNRIDEAKVLLQKAREIEPRNGAVLTLLRETVQKLKEHDARMARALQPMFSS